MRPAAAAPWAPEPRWWILLVTTVALGFATNWAMASAMMALLLSQMLRPFDFFLAFLLVIAGATFVEYSIGGLTLQLGILTCGIVFMLMCHLLSYAGRVLSVPRTRLTWILLAFLALTTLNTARGVLLGHSPKYIGLELLPLLGLGSAFLVASAFDRQRDLRWLVVGLILIGYVATLRGFLTFAATRAHGVGYTMAAPGIVAILLVNLALRSKTGMAAAGFTVLAVPMFLQQFITFGRGLWTGSMAALVATILIFVGLRRGSGGRWKRMGFVYGGLLVLGVVGALITAHGFEQTDLLREAGTRLKSSAGTELNYETRSNLIRLGEYLHVWNLIRDSPWIGHGVGFVFAMKQIISWESGLQWHVHQYFLFVWLKQGLLGLGLFSWMLVAAVGLGAREARRREDALESSWFATMAAATVFLGVLSLSNFPFGMVNEMFLLALLWGAAMTMASGGVVSLRWTDPGSTREDGRSRPLP